ncbi:MAG TPA: histidine phosphatase family protein [Dehalococcoidia bacterium]|nr:histidine phosphatase family protein [Dehalococcoidia bacterium]
MRPLYLIRHASPAIQPSVPAEEWVLSERGIEESHQLAGIAAGWGLKAVYSSREAKAMSTALILAGDDGPQVHTVDGLHELRLGGNYIFNADAFSERVRDVLDSPEVSVRGSETAASAAARFARAVGIVLQGPFPAAVVSHGRVLVAYLAAERGLEDAFEVWRALPMPGWICVDLDAPASKLATGFSGLPDA